MVHMMDKFFPEAVKLRREEVKQRAATQLLHTAIFSKSDPAMIQVGPHVELGRLTV